MGRTRKRTRRNVKRSRRVQRGGVLSQEFKVDKSLMENFTNLPQDTQQILIDSETNIGSEEDLNELVTQITEAKAKATEVKAKAHSFELTIDEMNDVMGICKLEGNDRTLYLNKLYDSFINLKSKLVKFKNVNLLEKDSKDTVLKAKTVISQIGTPSIVKKKQKRPILTVIFDLLNSEGKQCEKFIELFKHIKLLNNNIANFSDDERKILNISKITAEENVLTNIHALQNLPGGGANKSRKRRKTRKRKQPKRTNKRKLKSKKR